MEPILKINNLQTHFFTKAGILKAVDGVSFEASGFKPRSVVVSENRVVVMVPRSGGACVNTNGKTPSNNVSCYFVAVWDDYSQTFNSIGSGEPVFKLSDFNP